METRPFGKTGVSLPIFSLGAQRLVDDEGCSEDQAVEVLNAALDRGVSYFDTAWWYSIPNGQYPNGQSEQRVGLVARHRRKEMWIATKVIDRTFDGARRQLEESVTRLQTDYVEEWRLHGIDTFEQLDQATGNGGSLEAALKARDEEVVRFISLSSHQPQVALEALRRFPFDTMLVPISAMDRFIFSFEEEFLPAAARLNVGVVAMKTLAVGKLAHVADKALRYALGQPLTTIVVGCRTMQELEFALSIAEDFTPLTDTEQLELFAEALPLVTPENVWWKADDYLRPVGWRPRQEPSGLELYHL